MAIAEDASACFLEYEKARLAGRAFDINYFCCWLFE
jgi:hypothetical protein